MRPTPRRLVKTLFIVSMFGFLIINMNLFLDSRSGSQNSEGPLFNEPPERKNDNHVGVANFVPKANNNSVKTAINAKGILNNLLNNSLHDNTTIGKNTNSKNFRFDEYVPLGNDYEAIKAYIKQANKAQKIRNLDNFDLPSSQNGIVMVVQVHDRTEYLKYVIESLRKARYIGQSLLVFSHDYFSDDINKLIYQIDFCPVSEQYFIIFNLNSGFHDHELVLV